MDGLKKCSNKIYKCFRTNAAAKYFNFLNNHPITVMIITSFASISLTAIAFSVNGFPTFDDLKLGFETRNTEISGKIIAFKNIVKETSIYPEKSKKYFKQLQPSNNNQSHRYKRSDILPSFSVHKNNSIKVDLDVCNNHQSDLYKIDLLSQLVFKANNFDDLFTLPTILELCSYQNSLKQNLQPFQQGASFISLSNFVACENALNSCDEISDFNVNRSKIRVEFCLPFYDLVLKCHRLSNASFKSPECNSIPSNCTNMGELFEHILSNNVAFSTKFDPVYTTVFLPVIQYSNLQLLDGSNSKDVENYSQLHKAVSQLSASLSPRLSLVGESYGAKSELFSKYLQSDVRNMLLSLALISVIIWLYSDSLFYTVAVLITLMYSVGLAYFAYTLIFCVKIFPFMNLLVIVLLIGIGADDTFVLFHIFDLFKKSSENSNFNKQSDISEAFSNAALSMFVTSATTAASFYANFYSDVLVIKCFAIFAGSMMVMNYMLVISWLPACLVFFDRYITPLYYRYSSKKWLFYSYKFHFYCTFAPKVLLMETLMPWIVDKLKHFWVILLSTAFVASLLLIFYKPGLTMPKGRLHKMFRDNNKLEWYENEMDKYFEFSRQITKPVMELSLVWGFEPTVDTPYMTWDTSGILQRNSRFVMDVKFLQDAAELCKFFKRGPSLSIKSCFPQMFLAWSASQNCTAESTPATCCNYKSEPYFKPSDLGPCLATATEVYEINDYGGPLFVQGTNYDVHGFVLSSDSNFDFPLTIGSFGEYFEKIDAEIAEFLSNSTLSEPVKTGWLITTYSDHIMRYDIQMSLLRATPISIALSLAVALIIVIMITKEFLLSITAVFCILSVITSTAASLVLLRWSFNVIEATICILTVGLAFDFTLHYLVAYQLMPKGTSSEKLFGSLAYVGLPVLLSALTTFLAGCPMLASEMMAFFQTGLFMILISVISWLYSNLFYLSLLTTFGNRHKQCSKAIVSANRSRFGCCLGDENSLSTIDMNITINRTTTVNAPVNENV